MKTLSILAVLILGATGCATSRDLDVRDQRIAELDARLVELNERLEASEAIIRDARISEILNHIDEMMNEPVIHIELVTEE